MFCFATNPDVVTRENDRENGGSDNTCCLTRPRRRRNHDPNMLVEKQRTVSNRREDGSPRHQPGDDGCMFAAVVASAVEPALGAGLTERLLAETAITAFDTNRCTSFVDRRFTCCVTAVVFASSHLPRDDLLHQRLPSLVRCDRKNIPQRPVDAPWSSSSSRPTARFSCCCCRRSHCRQPLLTWSKSEVDQPPVTLFSLELSTPPSGSIVSRCP